VKDNGVAVANLNELEYIDGLIWSNIWYSNDIVMIDPLTGNVVRRLSTSGLHPSSGEVLNGIAYDETHDRLFITGKWWPTIFELQLCYYGQPTTSTGTTDTTTSETAATTPTSTTGSSTTAFDPTPIIDDVVYGHSNFSASVWTVLTVALTAMMSFVVFCK